MTGSFWLMAFAWGWFALLAIGGRFRPLAGTGSKAAVAREIEPGRIITNVGLSIGDLAIGLLIPASAILAAVLGEAGDFGLLHRFSLPPWAQIALAIVLSDLLLWAFHLLAHYWPSYWRFHRVHHCDTALDVLTSYRQHPLATVLAALLQAMGIAALGLDPVGVFAYQAVIAFHQPLHHSNLDWRLPPWLTQLIGFLFIRPSQHALHHSALACETNSNFGQLFSIWDRLAGTLRDADETHFRELSIGLGERYDPFASRIGSQLTLPFAPLEGPGPSRALSHLPKGNTRQ